MGTREEHLQWCKDRANELIDLNDLPQAFASMLSDMGKHEKTANHLALEMGTMLLMTGSLETSEQMRSYINGFN